jgi:type IV secretory pathway VirB2 component (pilin)
MGKHVKTYFQLFAKCVVSTGAILLFLFIPFVSPQAEVNPQEQFQDALQGGGVISGEIPAVNIAVQNILNVVLGFIGVAAFILVVYAGGLWMTAAGNDDQVGKAKKLLRGAIFGIVIVFTAFFLVNFVLDQLGKALGKGF